MQDTGKENWNKYRRWGWGVGGKTKGFVCSKLAERRDMLPSFLLCILGQTICKVVTLKWKLSAFSEEEDQHTELTQNLIILM